MDQLEKFFYEAKPYFFFGLGIYALTAHEPHAVLIACALILLFAAAFILRMRLKNRKGSPLENVVYEATPFFYLGLGLYALYDLRESKIAVGSALLLLFVGTMIIKWRHAYRREDS